MCELLGMSANVPTDICFSFSGLMPRGGRTGPHKDGWGIVFYEGKAARAFHDPGPCADSELAQLIQRLPIKSCNVISHIRKATHGRVTLENTHPFQRELWGRTWSFAHNGRLKGNKRWPLEFYQPVGTTDSEHAFCWLLDAVRRRYPQPPARRETLWRFVAARAAELDALGSFNMLLSDGRHLYAYCSTHLSWITRRAPFGEARLTDEEMRVDFAEVTTPDDVVTVVTTHPLTSNEVWTTMAPGSLTVFDQGLAYQVGRRGAVARVN